MGASSQGLVCMCVVVCLSKESMWAETDEKTTNQDSSFASSTVHVETDLEGG